MKILLAKEKLLELIKNKDVPDIMEEYYSACVNGEIEAYEREALVLALCLVLQYKNNQMFLPVKSADLFNPRKLCFDKFYELYVLFERTKFEIMMCMGANSQKISKSFIVNFLRLKAEFHLKTWDYFRCLATCNLILNEDNNDASAKFTKAMLVNLCTIVHGDDKYLKKLQLYKTTLMYAGDYNNIIFDPRLKQTVCKANPQVFVDQKTFEEFSLFCVPKDFHKTESGKNIWSEENEFYLREHLFLNPLNDFGEFFECSIEELKPLPLNSKQNELFQSLVDDYKYARKKYYEYKTQKSSEKRELCSAFCYLYTIFDKMAYLIKDIYNINLEKKNIYFNADLFNTKEATKKYALLDIKNPAVTALFYLCCSLHPINPDKINKLYVAPFEIADMRNTLEHRATSDADENALTLRMMILLDYARRLIFYSYFLFMGGTENLGELSAVSTDYANALYEVLKAEADIQKTN